MGRPGAVCGACGGQLIRQAEVAEALGMSLPALRKAITRGSLTLPAPKLGGEPGAPPYWCHAEVASEAEVAG